MNTTHELIEQHLQMVRKIALRLAAIGRVTPEKIEENIAAGYLGLVEAARNYKTNCPEAAPFATFAYLRIRGAMIDAIGKSSAYSRRTAQSLKNEQGQEVGYYVESNVKEAQQIRSDDCVEETLYRKQILERIVNAANSSLSLREQDVISRHYFRDESLTEIAGCSKRRSVTCKAHRKALDKLRRKLAVELKEES